MPTTDDLKRIAEIEFTEIIKNTYQIDNKLRIVLINNQNSVEASPFPLSPIDGFRAFMEFIRNKLR
jgi:hypothetical protein